MLDAQAVEYTRVVADRNVLNRDVPLFKLVHHPETEFTFPAVKKHQLPVVRKRDDVLPAQNIVPFPDNGELVLFYSRECKFCFRVMDEFEQRNIPVQHVPVSDYSGVLNSLGIEHVPTLLVNKGNEKIFLTG